jgi:serine/threonine protein kinase
VESPRTLLYVSPSWEPSPREGATRHISREAASPERHLGRAAEPLLLGRYRLLQRLGSGGFGVVWRARDELLDREVALKRIPLPDGDSERASREALASARLAHPAIVALYEACAEEDAFYLISELVHGQTLAALMAAGTLADEELLQIGVALAAALSHAHARGVIHRDVKPQNVLVPDRHDERSERQDAPLGIAKLTDFGGASLIDQEALTRTGDVLGTLAYMAPEQCEGHEVGKEADLYSLALVLYEALSGVNPVRGPTPAATARRIGRPLSPLGRRRGDLPRALTRALDVALAPSPPDRGSLDELRLALEDTLERGIGRSWRRRARPAHAPDRQASLWGEAHPVGPPPASPPLPLRLPRSGSPGQSPEEPIESQTPAQDRRLARGSPALPRALWLGLALAAILWQLAAGRPGLALLLLAGAAPLVALPRRTGPGWLACALAPALGVPGLAGCFPAIAGQAVRWRLRAALGGLGYWWLALAEPLLDRRLWLGHGSSAPVRAAWEASLGGAWHVVAPLLSLGVLLGAALWAGGAIVLPWIVRGRSAALDLVAATTWSAALAACAPMLDSGIASHSSHPSPRGVVLGAILGGLLAVAARALRGPV